MVHTVHTVHGHTTMLTSILEHFDQNPAIEISAEEKNSAEKSRFSHAKPPDGYAFERLERTRSMPDKLDVESRCQGHGEARCGDVTTLDDPEDQSGWFDRWWARLGDPAAVDRMVAAVEGWNAGVYADAKAAAARAEERQAMRVAKQRDRSEGVLKR